VLAYSNNAIGGTDMWKIDHQFHLKLDFSGEREILYNDWHASTDKTFAKSNLKNNLSKRVLTLKFRT